MKGRKRSKLYFFAFPFFLCNKNIIRFLKASLSSVKTFQVCIYGSTDDVKTLSTRMEYALGFPGAKAREQCYSIPLYTGQSPGKGAGVAV
jgi:hypothetical protein